MNGTQKVYEMYRSSGFLDTDVAAAAEGYSQMLRFLPEDRDARILDIGCGGGEFLAYLGQVGFSSAEGVDLSNQQITRCRERGLTRIELVKDVKSFLASHKASFATVVMNDVLEHIPKPEIIPTLEAIHGALREGGRCLVKVPNAANIFGLVARYLDFTHEVAFTEHSLRQVLLTAGYSDVALTGISVKLRPSAKRVAFWIANGAYRRAHRALYVVAVGSDAPRILHKLLLAAASK